MHTKLATCLMSLLLALGMGLTGPAIAAPDLPDPPDPDDLPKPPDPDDLPGVNTDEGRWWDPLGLFSDDDDDDHRGRGKGKGHDKHHKKHHKD